MKLIADNLRITKPAIQKALREKNPETINAMAELCENAGAWGIDVNTGPLGRDPEKGMHFFIRAVQEVTNLPLFIDTSNPKAMKAGLETIKNRPVLNGFSLEPKKVAQILPLARDYDADIVGFLLYPDSSVPRNAQQRFEVTLELFEKAEKAGVSKERIIIDPVVPPLAWEDGIVQARHVLDVIRTLPELLGFPVRTIAGISNLATRAENKNKKMRVTKAYLAMLAEAGLTYALIDILDEELVKTARTASVLSNDTLFSWGLVPD